MSKNECTGCQACQNVCPFDAIVFKPDNEGFYIPEVITSRCINCGKCYNVCPVNIDYRREVAEENYIVRLKDRRTLKKSASGGAFVGIANLLLEQKDTVVVGASLCEDLVVRHVMINSRKDIDKLQNSKYVQSYIGNTYMQVKEKLKAGQTVFFTGTPCQIAGLYATLSEKEITNLYTADIVCHGVPSPAFLKRQFEEDSKTEQGCVKNCLFRFKNPNFKSNSAYFMFLLMEHGLPIVRRTIQDPYYNLFIKGMNFRESCYKCKYTNLYRVGDFTLGDCDSREFYDFFYPNESNSILLLNSDKAKQLWKNGLKMEYEFCTLDLNREAIYNHQLNHPSKRCFERDGIYNELLYSDWGFVKEKYAKPQKKYERIKLLALLYTPQSFLRVLSRIGKWK